MTAYVVIVVIRDFARTSSFKERKFTLGKGVLNCCLAPPRIFMFLTAAGQSIEGAASFFAPGLMTVL